METEKLLAEIASKREAVVPEDTRELVTIK